LVVDTNVSGTSYTASLAGGKQYRWNVNACNSAGCSSYTTLLYFQTPATAPGSFTLSNESPICDITPPVAPALRLNWTSSSGAASYDLYRNGSLYSTGLVGTTFYNNANLTAGQTYTYFVRARNSSGTTDSNQISISVPGTICAASGDLATFVSETILDGTTITAGQGFTKSWTIRNSGTTTWNSGYRLRWVNGSNLSNHADVVIAGTVAPGSLYTFIVSMTAPASSGAYREDWKFINSSGTAIPVSGSGTIWVTITVSNNSGLDKADFVSETYLDGTSVTAGQGFTKTWTLHNSGTTTWNSNYRLRWVSGSNMSTHADAPVSGTVPPGSSYTFSVPMMAPGAAGTYREDWKLINGSGATVLVSGSGAVWVSIRVTAGGQSGIVGSVTSTAGGPIGGANIQIGSSVVQTDSQGNYSISSIAAGGYTATVNKTGYGTVSVPVSVPSNTQVRKDFRLQPNAPTTSITVTSITTKYRGRSYFLNGVSHSVTFTVNVDWGGHTPGSVSFITPKGTYIILTNSNTASKSFDMGSEFGTCGALRVKASSGDGTASPEAAANFVLMSPAPLLPASSLRLFDTGDAFTYEPPNEFTLKIPILENVVEGFLIPNKIPFFGSNSLTVSFDATAKAMISGDGTVKYTADIGVGQSKTNTDLLKFTKGQIGGQEFSLTSSFGASANFSDASCRWTNWSGLAGINGDAFFHRQYHIPQTLYIAYFDGGFGIKGNASFRIANLQPLSISTSEVTLQPYLKGHIGAGLDFVAAIEGGLTGGLNWKIYPSRDLVGTITGEYKVISKIFHYELEHKVFQCSYTLNTGAKNCDWFGFSSAKLKGAVSGLPLYQRDYLGLANYAAFQKSQPLMATQSDGVDPLTTSAAIQTNVFPLSDSSLSSRGNNLYLAWLYDDPARTAINRSVLVFSSWDGTAWSSPSPVADDGTGDFHPRVVAFPDGSALAAWEDAKAAMPDTSGVNELMSSVEVSASYFDPSSKQWTRTQRLTANGYLDRSPLLAGQSSNDALVIWISNEQNDLAGGAAKPNKLWAAKWNGTSWSSPQAVATIPQGVVKYDLTYRGDKGDVTLSLDTDNDSSTDSDHELYALHYENGVWGSLTRLTNDAVADDNPRLAIDSKGNEVLVWMKGDEIYSAANGNVEGRKLVAAPGHSTNAADFTLANTPEGRIALTWAGVTAQSDSDLQALFYDPALDVWGGASQLTSDQELEANIATAFYGDKLIAVYDRTSQSAQTDTQPLAGAAPQLSIPSPGASDLYMLSHRVGGDLAVKADSLEASPANPRPGEMTTLTVTVVNQGDTAARDIPVNFYQGDPNGSGILIGTAVLSATLAPGDEQQVSVLWTPIPTTTPFSIYAVIDPSQAIDDVNRSNNAISRLVVKPDLAIQSLRWERGGDNSVSVTARIVNVGSLPSAPTSVSFKRDSSEGALLASMPLAALNPDQSADVSIQWDTTGLGAPEYLLNIKADEGGQLDEYDKANNLATLTVSLNPSAPAVHIDATGYGVAENAGSVQIAVTRTGDTSGAATVAYSTSDGTARQRTDYTPAFGTLSFAPGETSKTFVILVTDNAFHDGNRTVNIRLSNASGAFLVEPAAAVLTITDNDGSTASPNPLDNPDARFYVQQHYHDFLNREPDAAGLDFWTRDITQCGSNAQCVEVKRINVSAAFFLSIEFQQTGYLIYRLHQAAFGTGERLQLNTFLKDTQEVGRNVVIGQDGWQQQLEANKQSFANAFAARPEFTSLYPQAMSPSQFIDALNLNTGASLTQAERNGLVGDLTSGQKSRAQVLRAVAENAAFSMRESNKAFVLMQYFGYLRRNPDDQPDRDFSGWQFWLDKLNQFNGNFIQAEMVKAFLSSDEYRKRFGQ
jgi:hypothetical protein